MLKTLSTKSAEPQKGIVRIVGNSRAGPDRSKIIDDEVDNEVEVDDKVEKKGQNLFKSKNLSKSKKTKSSFLISKAKMTFIKLRQAFVKAPIFHHFDTECHIRVETDVSGYAISRILCQVTSDNLG